MFRLLRFLPRPIWSPRAWRHWTAYVHWRQETYGVFYPDGRRQPGAFRQMLRQLPSYLRWLKSLDRLSAASRD